VLELAVRLPLGKPCAKGGLSTDLALGAKGAEEKDQKGPVPAVSVVYDVLGASLQVDRAVVSFLTVKRAQVFMPDWGPRPWGWEPDRVLPAVAGHGGCC